MNRQWKHFSHMIFKEERKVLSRKVMKSKINLCAPPSSKNTFEALCRNERAFLLALKKGSLTVEAAMIFPFFLSVFLGLFMLFGRYSMGTELAVQAAREAKQMGVAFNRVKKEGTADITIYKYGQADVFWIFPFDFNKTIIQKATCRAWVGFTGLDNREIYVYITPTGSVYHLSNDCTHLNLSVRTVTLNQARNSKNENGEQYRPCMLCDVTHAILVFITEEGQCYHGERSCSGLKRTVRQVPLSEVSGRACCIRCMERKDER